ncbi:metallophosphoesterase [Clostridium sp. MCC353]|uniref:metallophosphoesterase family protein n=1 Tax=Clostridium sp. MCC353 TaxID=2592646 RepID=UPI001C01239E|nr:metallophosphoesterase family protein [Clostridium sp. MCC353]MBT9779019.1 metallophosphoesterase [Clostridium sp. MCC353]
MKLLVISDLHSNIWALQKILDAEPHFDLLCCAGDLVDYGTAPKEVVDRMRSFDNIKMVQGNHDLHTVNIWKEQQFWDIPSQEYKWVHHNCRRLDEARIGYLNKLPLHLTFEADGYVYLIQHQYDEAYGVIESRSQFDAYWDRFADPGVGNLEKRRMIFGHSHRQCVHVLGNGREWLNPGSVSYRRPDDPDKTAHYAVIEDGNIRLCQVDYDRSRLFEEARDLARKQGMMTTELQDFFFFFGDAKTSRDPLP